jgi:biotin-dependent carboxylase-like uncharacterized protein
LRIHRITRMCQLQDLGRGGYQNFGVNLSGAMDPYSLRLANILLGNPQGMAGLEFALAGAIFEVTTESMRVAFVGDFPLRINGATQPANASYCLHKGERLEIGATTGGIHGYLAVSGGFRVEKQLGSCATHLRTGLGGFGLSPTAGTILPVNHNQAARSLERYLPDSVSRKSRDRIRVIQGPQSDHFTNTGLGHFFSKPYRISRNSDRMAYRLSGTPIELSGDGNIISEPVIPGCVQVPANGEPMILMADCGTVGGYPKIAVVISVDLGRVAQFAPETEIFFEQVSVDQAQFLLREQEQLLDELSNIDLEP